MQRYSSDRVAQIRRDLHRIAETAYNEVRTSEYVASTLHDLGIEVTTGVAKTGVVGLIRGALPGPTVALRSDMDALPVQEETGLGWESNTPGVMHACGHDAHMAMLLGAAMLLMHDVPNMCGNVKLIFQPAEESPGGAEPMIAEGVMEGPHVDRVVGMHVTPELDVGQAGMKRGYATAAQDMFRLVLTGCGGHAATPQKTVDALAAACEFVSGLQQVVSRRVDPLEAAIVSVGRLHAGTSFNVVASSAQLDASVRTLSDSTRELVESLIRGRVRAIEQATGVKADLDYIHSYPSVVNDSGMIATVTEALGTLLGRENVVDLPTPSMVGEDFAYFARKAPGVMIWMGAAPVSGDVYPLHHSRFLVPEETLPIGAAAWRAIALSVLRSMA